MDARVGSLESLDTRNPYPGLRPFQADETHLFFGRDEQRIELLNRLRRSRFLAITGTSGSGKSSLVRAGLLPGLHGGFMAGPTDSWHIVDLRPGTDAIGNLARALDAPGALREQSMADGEPSFTATTLRRSGLGLVEVVREARLPRDDKVLVLVDQFEELFRAAEASDPLRYGDDASAFVTLLLEAASQPELPIYVVLTMRSDFLGECSRFRGLPEAINDGQYLVPRLTPDQRIQAITGPAAVFGVKLTSTLVNRLLNDVGENPDQLPILQHALMRTWSRWERQPGPPPEIDLVDYDAIGGMARALSLHADAVFDGLTLTGEPEVGARRQRIAEKLFRSLARMSPSGIAVRRFAQVQEVAEVSGESAEEVIAVVEAFRGAGNSFLMPPPGEPLDAETHLDISHESLIRNWDKMIRWTAAETDSARVYRRLSETALKHEVGESGLLRQPELGMALKWRDSQQPNAAWARRHNAAFETAMHFLDLSQSMAQAMEDARARRRRVWIFSVAVLVFLMATAMVSASRQELGRIDSMLKEGERAGETLRLIRLVGAFRPGGETALQGQACSGRPQPESPTKHELDKLLDTWCQSKPLSDDRRRLAVVFQQITEGRWADATTTTNALRDTDDRDMARDVLSRLASTRLPTDREERSLLLKLQASAPSAAASSVWQGRAGTLIHPVHRRIALQLLNGGRAGLTKTEGQLVDIYFAADAARRAGTASDLNDNAIEFVNERLPLPEQRAYGQVARVALSPESKFVEMLELATSLLRDYAWGIALLMVWPAWRLRRFVQHRRGQPIAPRAGVVRVVAAAALDIALVVAVGVLVSVLVQSALESVGLLLKRPFSAAEPIGATLGIASAGLWLLGRDALKLRYRRSIGKVLFDLRPLRTDGGPAGAVTLPYSAKRNLVLPVLLLAAWGLALAAGFIGIALGLLLLVVYLVASAIASWRKRPTLGERFSKTRLVDAECAESLAARP